MLFFKKSELEKRAEKGDKSAILELLRKGKKEKAKKLLERYEEDPDLKKVLFDLYLQEENYMQAYRLLERAPELGTARDRGLVYEKVGNYTKAVEEYMKVGDFESLYRVGSILYATGKGEGALEVLERTLKIAPPSKKEEVEEKIREVKRKLGLLEEKKESLLDKLRRGLQKTKESVELGLIFRGRRVDEELFEELEEHLVRADVGVKTAVALVEELRKTAVRKNVKSSEELKEITKEKVKELLKGCEGRLNLPEDRKPVVVLFLGVNGSGKTTTIGKLAHRLTSEGKKVMLVAGDTFRTAAIEQLEVWAQRSGADLTKKHEGADPASVVYEGLEKAKEGGYDVVLVDTAGRLHTKEPLINELRKIKKVVQKLLPEEPSETLLVLDATIGQNSIQQAKVFKEAVDISGIVVTKLDGSAKGGAVMAICKELRIPIKLIGVGEDIEDLEPFSVEAYVDALFD